MRIEKVTTEDYAILHLKGEFDAIFFPRFNEEVESLLAEGRSWVVVNLRFVRFINSTALGAIIKAKKAATAAKGDLVISQPSAFCKDVLQKVGLDKIIKVFEDDEVAVAHILKNLGEERDPVESQQSPLLFWFAEAKRNAQLPNHVALGRLVNFDESTAEVAWDFGKTKLKDEDVLELLAPGTDLRIKFRIPMFSKEYFEIDSAVREAKLAGKQAANFIVRFTRVEKDVAERLGQFLKDMRFLKDTLREETGR
ncbi:MAG: STAS domain-containing protein [Planctomycetes bacterium]|nr:STAS domain-containing protein [Planctomycetota bacterium]